MALNHGLKVGKKVSKNRYFVDASRTGAFQAQ